MQPKKKTKFDYLNYSILIPQYKGKKVIKNQFAGGNTKHSPCGIFIMATVQPEMISLARSSFQL